MLEVDNQLSDWDSDSDDGELLDVPTTINKDGGKGRNLPHCSERLDARMAGLGSIAL